MGFQTSSGKSLPTAASAIHLCSNQTHAPYAWWYGKLIVLDENFQKINELSLIAPTADEGLIENHDLLLTDNHYILTGYRQRKERINGRKAPLLPCFCRK